MLLLNIYGLKFIILKIIYSKHLLMIWSKKRRLYEALKYSVHLKDTTAHLKDAWLMLFREIIAVFCENHMKHIKTRWCKIKLQNFKASRTYSKLLGLNGLRKTEWKESTEYVQILVCRDISSWVGLQGLRPI